MKTTAKELAIEIYREMNSPLDERNSQTRKSIDEIILPYISEDEKAEMDKAHRIKSNELKMRSALGDDWRKSAAEVLSGV